MDRIASILASEIECGVFESHVAPALEIARRAVADDAQDVARAPLTDEQRIAIQECVDYLTPAAKEFSDLGLPGMGDSKHARCIQTLRSLLAAKAELSSAVPVGWQIVPSVATEEMADAGNKAMLRHWANGIYEAMLAAAPAAPAVCATCKGTRVVDDGEITGSGGVEFENGPIKCVKDCPDCAAPAQAEQQGDGGAHGGSVIVPMKLVQLLGLARWFVSLLRRAHRPRQRRGREVVTPHPHFNEDALINAAYALVSSFADCRYTSEQIKQAMHPQMIDAYLALRAKRDAERYGANSAGEGK
jgi:hypothetical protein